MWFNEVFLQSVFERQENRQVFLTAKQVNVCTRYFRQVSRLLENSYGGYRSKPYYEYTWHGRNLTLEVYSNNGCGCLIFGLDAEEVEEARRKNEEEREKIRVNRAKRLQKEGKARDRHLARIARAEADLLNARTWIEEHPDDVEPEDLEDVEFYENEVKRLYHEMEI